MNSKAESRIELYRNALKRLYGDDIARLSTVRYVKGWFKIALAGKSGQSGQYHPDSMLNVRGKELDRMTETLNNRIPNQKES